MGYNKQQQDGGGAPNRGTELLKRDEAASGIRRAKAAARKTKAKSNKGTTPPEKTKASSGRGNSRGLTRVVQLSPYRTQIEQILGTDADTLGQAEERLRTAIDKVATRYNWTDAMLDNARTYAIKLVHGDGDIDPDKLSSRVRRAVEQRFATTAWFMRHQLTKHDIRMYGVSQDFFKGDYETAQRYHAA